MVVKPANGVYGQGVQIIQRGHDNRWMDGSGQAFTTQSIACYCANWSSFERFMVQQKIHNHPRITALTGINTLQTVRVITVATRRSEPGEIILANWRIAGSESVVDNFDYGRGGNLIADIDIANGEIRQVVGSRLNRQGIEKIDKHPLTGISIKGFTLPHWEEVRRAVTNGTVHFAPLRLIGWDVALTPDGPMLIEANAWFDAGQNAFRKLPILIQKMKAVRSK